MDLERAAAKLKAWVVPQPDSVPEGWYPELGMILEWLDLNIKGEQRALSAKHLYIHGPTGIGKTSLVDKLREYLSVYDVPHSEDFYDYYQDGVYDLAVMDEFKANKQLQWMNLWLQGFQMTLRVKGAQRIKKQNLPTLILSNYSVEESYKNKNQNQLAPLFRRLTVLKCEAPLYPLIELFE